jgi:hypothetical protein
MWPHDKPIAMVRRLCISARVSRLESVERRFHLPKLGPAERLKTDRHKAMPVRELALAHSNPAQSIRDVQRLGIGDVNWTDRQLDAGLQPPRHVSQASRPERLICSENERATKMHFKRLVSR